MGVIEVMFVYVFHVLPWAAVLPAGARRRHVAHGRPMSAMAQDIYDFVATKTTWDYKNYTPNEIIMHALPHYILLYLLASVARSLQPGYFIAPALLPWLYCASFDTASHCTGKAIFNQQPMRVGSSSTKEGWLDAGGQEPRVFRRCWEQVVLPIVATSG